MFLDAVASPSSWCCQWVSESDDDDDDDVDHRQVHTVRAKLPETWKSGFLDRSNIFYCSICFSRIPTFDIFLSWKRIDWNSNQTIPSCIYKLPSMPASVFYNDGFPHVLLWQSNLKSNQEEEEFCYKTYFARTRQLNLLNVSSDSISDFWSYSVKDENCCPSWVSPLDARCDMPPFLCTHSSFPFPLSLSFPFHFSFFLL